MTQIILFLTIFFNLFLGVFILTYSRKSLSHQLFSLMSFLAAIWTFTNYMTDRLSSPSWLATTYALGSAVISIGLLWTFSITEKKLVKWKVFSILSAGLIFFVSSLQQGFITTTYHEMNSDLIFIGKPQFGLILYTIYYFIMAGLIVGKIYLTLRISGIEEDRKQLRNILVGAFITLSVVALNSFIFPFLFIHWFEGFDSIGFLVFLMFIAYSITRHNLFNIKVITTQVIVFLLWTLMISHILIEKDLHAMTLELAMLLIAIIFGIILIRYVFYSIEQTKKIDKLNLDLKDAYSRINDLSSELNNSQLPK